MLKKVILWLMVLGCMATIFGFSSQVAEESEETSSKVVTKVVKKVDEKNEYTEHEKEKITKKITFFVRKGAHFSIYALLGVLLFLLANEYRFSVKKCIATSICVAFLYACSDEFHQTFVSGRSGEIRDIIIDTVGASVGCFLIVYVKLIVRKIKNRRSL